MDFRPLPGFRKPYQNTNRYVLIRRVTLWEFPRVQETVVFRCGNQPSVAGLWKCAGPSIGWHDATQPPSAWHVFQQCNLTQTLTFRAVTKRTKR